MLYCFCELANNGLAEEAWNLMKPLKRTNLLPTTNFVVVLVVHNRRVFFILRSLTFCDKENPNLADLAPHYTEPQSRFH